MEQVTTGYRAASLIPASHHASSFISLFLVVVTSSHLVVLRD